MAEAEHYFHYQVFEMGMEEGWGNQDVCAIFYAKEVGCLMS